MQYTFHIFGVIQQQTHMKMSIWLTYNYIFCLLHMYLNSQQYGAWLCAVEFLLSPLFFKKVKGILLSPPSVRLSVCYLLLNHWIKSNQILVHGFLTWMGRAETHFLAPPSRAVRRGQKVKFHLISITKSISKIFIPNFVCVLTNKRYKINQTGFLFCHLGLGGIWGLWGAQGVISFCFETWPCGISNWRVWWVE